MALACERIIPKSDRRLLAELVPTFSDRRVSCSQRGASPTAVISVF
jgi:hypothetical protein